MVSTNAVRTAQASEYVEIMENTGFTAWLDAIDSSERERRLLEFFRAAIPDESLPAHRVSDYVSEALQYLELRNAHDAYVAVGIEAIALMAARGIEDNRAMSKVERLLGMAKSAEPDGALKDTIDTIIASRVAELCNCLNDMADLAGLDAGTAKAALSVKEVGDLCSVKFQEITESPEYAAGDKAFYDVIKSGERTKLAKSLERKKEVDISESMKQAERLESQAERSAKAAMRELSMLLNSSAGERHGSGRILRAVSAMAYLRAKAPAYRLLLYEVVKPVIASYINKASKRTRSTLAKEITEELLAVVDSQSERSICKAALLIEKLTARAPETLHRKE